VAFEILGAILAAGLKSSPLTAAEPSACLGGATEPEPILELERDDDKGAEGAGKFDARAELADAWTILALTAANFS
jgi:hypothetical protein